MSLTPISVLLVADSHADARLLLESLKDAGRDAFRVTHLYALAAALARVSGDIVVVLDADPSAGPAEIAAARAGMCTLRDRRPDAYRLDTWRHAPTEVGA